MARTGTLTLDDLLGIEDQTVIQYGEDTVAETITRELQQYSQQVEMAIADLAEITPDTARKYGTVDGGEMSELDELGAPTAQKVRGGSTVGFPMGKVGYGIGFTRDFLVQASPADVARQTIAREKAYLGWILRSMKNALLRSTNYTFADRFGKQKGIELPVKALVNGDGADVPRGPFNEEFDPDTHSHYSAIDWAAANAAQREAAAVALVVDVVEHGDAETVVVYINENNATDWEALDDFKPLQEVGIKIADGQLMTERLDQTVTNNRKIGRYRGADVWVKPWIPEDYSIALNLSAPSKPLVWRVHNVASMRGLRLAAMLDDYPLRADLAEAYGGAGVYGRTSAAVLYMGGAVYAAPAM